MNTPWRLDIEGRAVEIKARLEKCWRCDIKWELYPEELGKVCLALI